MARPVNRYVQIIERIFSDHHDGGEESGVFQRSEIESIASDLGIVLPKNLGDILYSFRYRAALPESIRKTAPEGKVWVIRSVGRSQYQFALVPDAPIVPSLHLAETKVPDSTPGIVTMYSGTDEQALLAKVRYNRLLDIFTGIAAYSLQNHLRTAIAGVGQVETDEVYVGINRMGAHYVFPVQAKGGSDRIGIVQVEQDMAMCRVKFPSLICVPVSAQFITSDKIAIFSFEDSEHGAAVVQERHYRLVPPDAITPEDLEAYRLRVESTDSH